MKGLEWSNCGFARRVTLLLATGLGLGLSPIASGTAGTLLGVLIVVGLPQGSLVMEICLATLLVLIALPVCDVAEKHFGTKDDSRIVADEYLTFPMSVIGLPWMAHPWLLALAFVTHRGSDIIKPFPARRLQAVKGGAGVLVDDVISSAYALALNHLVYWLVRRYL